MSVALLPATEQRHTHLKEFPKILTKRSLLPLIKISSNRISTIVDRLIPMEVGVDGEASIAAFNKWRDEFSKVFQFYLDRSTPLTAQRWMGTAAVAAVYVLRVYLIQGFYIITYGLGIYLLNLLIGFLSPKVDPELEALDGAALPTKGSDEFKPFIRRLPEFKFW